MLQMTDIGLPLNTNVLRIALNIKEERIAMLLVAYYKAVIDQSMLVRAIKTDQMNFLYCLYAFNKNYELDQEEESDSSEDSDVVPAASGVSGEDNEAEKYRTFTYDFLVKMILNYCEEKTVINQRISAVANWKIQSNENFLKTLLINY